MLHNVMVVILVCAHEPRYQLLLGPGACYYATQPRPFDHNSQCMNTLLVLLCIVSVDSRLHWLLSWPSRLPWRPCMLHAVSRAQVDSLSDAQEVDVLSSATPGARGRPRGAPLYAAAGRTRSAGARTADRGSTRPRSNSPYVHGQPTPPRPPSGPRPRPISGRSSAGVPASARCNRTPALVAAALLPHQIWSCWRCL